MIVHDSLYGSNARWFEIFGPVVLIFRRRSMDVGFVDGVVDPLGFHLKIAGQVSIAQSNAINEKSNIALSFLFYFIFCFSKCPEGYNNKHLKEIHNMSEESKTPDGDYVMMGSGAASGGAPKVSLGLDDPNLSQEDKDHRLAIALQQEENAAVYDAHKKKHEQNVKANTNRTARSGTFTKLAAVRQKDHGMLSVPADYTTPNAYVKESGDYLAHVDKSEGLVGATPQQTADYQLAKELQKVEQVGAGTAREMSKIVGEEAAESEAQAHRVERSNYHINQKGLRFP